jgi:hypothetical protein
MDMISTLVATHFPNGTEESVRLSIYPDFRAGVMAKTARYTSLR